MPSTADDIIRALRKGASTKKARVLSRFFKTGKGEYAEGDIFLGVMVPHTRMVVKMYAHISQKEIGKLLCSPYHEVRLAALLLLVKQYQDGDEKTQKRIVEYYLAHTRFINNWDLVDLSAHKILGAHLVGKSIQPLVLLAQSKNIWERRIAVISTFACINKGKYHEAFRVAKLLIDDDHDLIHKAVGWMLRAVGDCCGRDTEERFLRKHYHTMPRTMLRYAIEKFPVTLRRSYLRGTVRSG
ncbi:MAG: DNA alkylation repair protein [Patescibacteria group bacterium]